MLSLLTLFLATDPVSASTLPAPLAEAMAPRTDVDVATYQVEMESQDIVWQAKVDPSQDEGERVDVLSPPEAEWPKGSKKVIAEFDKNADGDIWCDGMDEMVGRDIKELSANDTEMSYQFKPLIPEDADKTDRKFAEAALGKIDLRRGDDGRWHVANLKLWIEKPFKPVFVAKLTRFDLNIACAPTETGRMYQASTTTRAQGSAMGKKFDENESVAISQVELRR